MIAYHSYLSSPYGSLKISSTNDHITSIERVKEKDISIQKNNATLREAKYQLTEYFNKKRKVFDLPIDLSSGTAFQQKVWKALLTIPYGRIISYEDLANEIGQSNAVRAVASANANNPIAIIVPCHRVVGKNGKLRGYAYGIEMKRGLIEMEEGKRKQLYATLFQ